VPQFALVYDLRIVVQAGSKVEAEGRGKGLEETLKDRLRVPGPISQSHVKFVSVGQLPTREER
jgi:hypothetical protein